MFKLPIVDFTLIVEHKLSYLDFVELSRICYASVHLWESNTSYLSYTWTFVLRKVELE